MFHISFNSVTGRMGVFLLNIDGLTNNQLIHAVWTDHGDQPSDQISVEATDIGR
jgi:hypothetical protein